MEIKLYILHGKEIYIFPHIIKAYMTHYFQIGIHTFDNITRLRDTNSYTPALLFVTGQYFFNFFKLNDLTALLWWMHCFVWWLICAMSYKRRHVVILAGFRMATFRLAKIRQTVAENATRTFVWRGERSPCENTNKSTFGGFSRGDLSRFRPCLSYLCMAGRKVATRKPAKGLFRVAGRKVAMRKHEKVTILRVFVWRLKMCFENEN